MEYIINTQSKRVWPHSDAYDFHPWLIWTIQVESKNHPMSGQKENTKEQFSLHRSHAVEECYLTNQKARKSSGSRSGSSSLSHGKIHGNSCWSHTGLSFVSPKIIKRETIYWRESDEEAMETWWSLEVLKIQVKSRNNATAICKHCHISKLEGPHPLAKPQSPALTIHCIVHS